MIERNTSPRRMPSVKAIRDARPELGYYDNSLGDDKAHCWACGSAAGGVKRAHILPRWRGGSDDPLNFFLLCPPCYGEQDPLDAMPTVWQWAWLYAHESEFNRFMRISRQLQEMGETPESLAEAFSNE